jgi:Lon protease-like protein
MPMNAVYRSAADLPEIIPVFPLPGVLLLPRGTMPLNIFEPRYLAMIDDALKSSRLIGMIQPEIEGGSAVAHSLQKVGCAGRITQFSETGDGRYLVTLTGVSRFRVDEERAAATPYRLCSVDFSAYSSDLVARAGEERTNREGVIRALRAFTEARNIDMEWKGVHAAPTEALVNALAMMSPFGPREKQALLEAPDLATRAEILIAITEIELARHDDGSDAPLQ